MAQDVRDTRLSVPDDPVARRRMWLPDGLHSGVHADTGGDASGLLEVGDNWAGPAHEIPVHRHAGWELYLQVHGVSTWALGDLQLTLAPGWVVAVPPGLEHRSIPHARAGTRHHFAYVSFDPAVVAARRPELGRAWSGRSVAHSAVGYHLHLAFRAVLREVTQDRALAAVALPAALDLLLVEAARTLLAHGDGSLLRWHPAVLRARHLLDEEYARPWSLEELAVACALSRAHLAELFTRQVGQPPYRYLLERRVERAAELLDTTASSVSDVAAEVGFSSHAQLGRSFRQVLDCSPSEWRRRDHTTPDPAPPRPTKS